MWVRNADNFDFFECEECRHEAYWDTDCGQQLFDYCPYCGACCRSAATGCEDAQGV